MTYGISNIRTKPRIRFLDKNWHNINEGLGKSLSVRPGVTILSGQVCSQDPADHMLELGWTAGNGGPYIAVNDSTDEATLGTGMGTADSPYKLVVIGFDEARTIQTGFYVTTDTYAAGSRITPDGTTGDVKLLTNSGTEVQLGFASVSAIQMAAAITPPGGYGTGENATTSNVTDNTPSSAPVVNIFDEIDTVTPSAAGVINVLTFRTGLRLPTLTP